MINIQLLSPMPSIQSYCVRRCTTKGIIISDDMQMHAISQHYSLEEATSLAINAGVDILLLEINFLITVQRDCRCYLQKCKNGTISRKRIIEANKRIDTLLMSYKIKQKPIIFTKKRIRLTQEYIQNHYNLKVSDIKIQPKMIVVHWTAIEDLNRSFERFNQELLFSDRADIAKASALNVSTHYLIDRDGEIYQLMPDNIMARHVIGLNYSSIGIENVEWRRKY
ncbi:MAG: N-acetylmuramoyl-L-alanine amidase [Sulfurimonas sp.]|nr:N-acetylmuramoyl-L-alanine amidase [Sulfurimonas sp.]